MASWIFLACLEKLLHVLEEGAVTALVLHYSRDTGCFFLANSCKKGPTPSDYIVMVKIEPRGRKR